MSAALKTLDKIKESLDSLNRVIAGFMEKAQEEVSGAQEEVLEPSNGEVVEEPSEPAEAVEEASKRGRKKGGINKSDLIREYFRKHGSEVKNKDLIAEIEKVHKVKIEPSLVSTIKRSVLGGEKKTRPEKTTRAAKAKIKAKAAAPKGELKGLPMPALCTAILKKSNKEGLKWKEITERVIESGYDYKGSKGYLGIAQNVYQALHSLSQKKSHPGYSGKVAVVLHDEPSKRWKLNPKATKTKKIA